MQEIAFRVIDEESLPDSFLLILFNFSLWSLTFWILFFLLSREYLILYEKYLPFWFCCFDYFFCSLCKQSICGWIIL